MDIERIQPGAWNSKAVVYNGVVYLSGITADDKTLPMKAQTEPISAKIDGVLVAAGTNKSRILSPTVYLADMSKKDEMNEAWTAWMNPDNPPARAAVGTKLTPGRLVEIMVCATK